MPRNGTGQFTLASPPGPPQNGTTASATDMTTLLQDISASMTASTANDGQTKITGSWDWQGYNISNLATLSAASGVFSDIATSNGATVGNVLTVTKGGATITGNSTVTGTLTVTTAGTSGNQAINFSQFPATKASPGTMTLPSGMIVKWGTGTTTAGAGSVTYAAAFPTATLNVQITISGAAGTITVRPLALGATTAAGFAVWGDAAESFGFNWLAFGH